MAQSIIFIKYLHFYSFSIDSLSRISTTGRHTWTGTLKGVDWKSLCFPACLPLTIHHFPDHKTLSELYAEYNYNIVIDEDDDFVTEPSVSSLGASNRSTLKENRFDHTELPPEEKFLEMITQRISRVSTRHFTVNFEAQTFARKKFFIILWQQLRVKVMRLRSFKSMGDLLDKWRLF